MTRLAPRSRPSRAPSASAAAKQGIAAAPSKLALHRAVAHFLAMALPPDAWWTTIPAGNSTRRHGARNKALGYQRGTPDLVVIYRGLAVFVELKAAKGCLSGAQEFAHVQIRNAGAPVCVARSVADVETALRENGVWLKESVISWKPAGRAE